MGLIKEITCLHLARIQMPPSEYAPNSVDIVHRPLVDDLRVMGMRNQIPELLESTRPIIIKKGIGKGIGNCLSMSTNKCSSIF